MVQLSHFFVALSLLSVGFSSPAKRTVAQVESDIASISTQVTTLDNAIKAFPATGGTLLQALTIHTDATSLDTTLNQATTDATATGPVGETDGRTILSSVEAFEPTILEALTQIACLPLPVGGIPALILQDLQNLKSATVSFSNSLITSAPADLKAEATALTNNITTAFNTAIAAYS
ncbi:hydrophobic surface binding protein A-domain-containing protein [Mycena sp. CBHHK59/15]|nr:hydrophobic surface binding protein A-domain-containing protein [Mycena sp. CBHHK59/15]